MCYIVFETLFIMQQAIGTSGLAFGRSASIALSYVSHNCFFFIFLIRRGSRRAVHAMAEKNGKSQNHEVRTEQGGRKKAENT